MNVKQLKAPIGRAVALPELEKELKSGKKYKVVTVTHVDTSTGLFQPQGIWIGLNSVLGVLTNVRNVAALIRRLSPDTLVRKHS